MNGVQTLHDQLVRHGALMTITRSVLSNGVSSHYTRQSMSFAQLERFLEGASKLVGDQSKYNIGSLGGELVISVGLRQGSAPPPPKSGKKRGYDDSADRAKAAVDAARKRLMKDSSITEAMLKAAEEQIQRMFRDVKGANNELVFESLGLSVTTATVVSASASSAVPSASSRPKLIVACRLSAGIAMPVYALRSALGTDKGFPDGMMTTNPESLGPEYRLPLSELGRAAEGAGQHSILLFSAVPPPVAPKPAPK